MRIRTGRASRAGLFAATHRVAQRRQQLHLALQLPLRRQGGVVCGGATMSAAQRAQRSQSAYHSESKLVRTRASQRARAGSSMYSRPLSMELRLVLCAPVVATRRGRVPICDPFRKPDSPRLWPADTDREDAAGGGSAGTTERVQTCPDSWRVSALLVHKRGATNRGPCAEMDLQPRFATGLSLPRARYRSFSARTLTATGVPLQSAA